MTRLSFQPVGDSFLLVVVVALVLLALLAVGPGRDRLSGRRRLGLAALRAVVIGLVTLAMLRPTLISTETKKQSATLILLADKSRSMSVQDVLGGKARWDALRRALADAEPALGELARDFELKAYAFDEQPRALSEIGRAHV